MEWGARRGGKGKQHLWQQPLHGSRVVRSRCGLVEEENNIDWCIEMPIAEMLTGYKCKICAKTLKLDSKYPIGKEEG